MRNSAAFPVSILALLLIFGACSSDLDRVQGRGPSQRISPNGPEIGVAIAKCHALGYVAGPAAAACVRAMRADVCGDGISFTRDGVLIEIDPPGWTEAVWGPGGALCLGPGDARHDVIAGRDPWCLGVTVRPCQACGAGALATRVVR